MQSGARLASLGLAVSPASRRSLVSFGRPLAVAAVLTVGATLFSSAAALLGSRQSAAVFHTAPDAAAAPTVHSVLHELPLPKLPGRGSTGFDDALASLKGGAFGLTFEPHASATPVSETREAGAGSPRPGLLIDAALPPLRIEIMGLHDLHYRQSPAARLTQP